MKVSHPKIQCYVSLLFNKPSQAEDHLNILARKDLRDIWSAAKYLVSTTEDRLGIEKDRCGACKRNVGSDDSFCRTCGNKL